MPILTVYSLDFNRTDFYCFYNVFLYELHGIFSLQVDDE
jgi:hypothetical protein